MRSSVAVNCAGLEADAIARLAGDESFSIYPRKGEFLVFDPPAGARLDQILMPVHTKRTKGVLVFPTINGKVVAGPTAVDLEDKRDWSVRAAAREEIIGKAAPCTRRSTAPSPSFAYAGLRPAGRDVNYVIGPARDLSAAGQRGRDPLHRAERVARDRRARDVDRGLARRGARPRARRSRAAGAPPDRPWWRRTADYRASVAA